MMDYTLVREWSRIFELVQNRISVINQVLGARYDGDLSNPLLLRYSRGFYTCEVCGETFARFKVYDVPATTDAFDRLESLNDGIWLLNRSGRLSFT